MLPSAQLIKMSHHTFVHNSVIEEVEVLEVLLKPETELLKLVMEFSRVPILLLLEVMSLLLA